MPILVTDTHGIPHETFDVQVLSAFAQLPLHLQMASAARVLREANIALGEVEDDEWRPSDVGRLADEVREKIFQKAQAEAEVEELASRLFELQFPEGHWNTLARPTVWHDRATELIAAGYRKADE